MSIFNDVLYGNLVGSLTNSETVHVILSSNFLHSITTDSLFINKSEVSAQEAAFGILRLPLSLFSRDHVFINTGPPEERVVMTKARKDLE